MNVVLYQKETKNTNLISIRLQAIQYYQWLLWPSKYMACVLNGR